MNIRATLLTIGLAAVLWMAIAFVGAGIFQWLEAEHEAMVAVQDAATEEAAGLRFHGSMHTHANATTIASEASNATVQIEALEALVADLRQHCKQAPPSVDNPSWTLAGSLFFALQLMTTIGYGAFVPSTTGGVVFVIVFGLFGIVMSALLVGVLTEAIDDGISRLHALWLAPRHGEKFVEVFHIAVTTLALFTYLILFALVSAMDPSVLVGYDPEAGGATGPNFGAEFVRSFYFLFVTFSTIGFGDVTLRYESVLIVVAQYFAFLPGLALFAQYTQIGITFARRRCKC